MIYLRLNNQTLIVLRKKHSGGVARKREKKKEKETSKARKFGAFGIRMSRASGCPWRPNVPSVRIPRVSCLASGRSCQDVLLHPPDESKDKTGCRGF